MSPKDAGESPEKKARRNIAAIVNIILIALVLLSGAAYLLAAPRETVSSEENRRLTPFPDFSPESCIDGSFTSGLADHYDDTVCGRAEIKKLVAANVSPLKGRKYGGGDDGAELYGVTFERKGTPVVTAPATTAPAVTTQTRAAAPAATTTTAAVTARPKPVEPATDGGEIASNILVVNKRGLPLYSSGDPIAYAETANQFKRFLGDTNLWSMTIPTAGGFYLPENYKKLADDEERDIKRIADALENVGAVDAFGALLEHKSENIYARTDHHWLALGAYYAAEEFAKTAGVPFKDLSAYEELRLHDYLGTLYGYTQSSVLLENPEEFIYYKPKEEVVVTQYDTAFQNPLDVALLVPPDNLEASGYYYVFGMDSRIAHVHTNVGNGRKLVIFKDSFGNALLPFLTYSFEDIYLCDIRYFDLNAVGFAKWVEATDVLLAMSDFSATGPNLEYLKADIYW